MTNEMKLLRAFIEASGYEVETTEDIKHTYRIVDRMDNGDIKENAMPESIIKTTDYKVTKKDVIAGTKQRQGFSSYEALSESFTQGLVHSYLNPKKKSITLVDGGIYKFNYKSNSKSYDNCVMTYNEYLDKFTCFKFQLDLAFCTDIKKVGE